MQRTFGRIIAFVFFTCAAFYQTNAKRLISGVLYRHDLYIVPQFKGRTFGSNLFGLFQVSSINDQKLTHHFSIGNIHSSESPRIAGLLKYILGNALFQI